VEIWQKNALVNIAAVIAESKLSQASFAKCAKINANHLNMVLNGRRPVSRQLVATVAHYVGQETDWFYLDHSSRQPPPESPSAAAMAEVILKQQQEIERLKQHDHASSIHLTEEEAKFLKLFRAADKSRQEIVRIFLTKDPSRLSQVEDYIQQEIDQRQAAAKAKGRKKPRSSSR